MCPHRATSYLELGNLAQLKKLPQAIPFVHIDAIDPPVEPQFHAAMVFHKETRRVATKHQN